MEHFPVKEEVLDSSIIEEEQEFETLELQGGTGEEINLLDHCVICLRKLFNDSSKNEGKLEPEFKPRRGRSKDNQRIVKVEDASAPESTFSSSLSSLSHIWPYLNEKWRKNVGEYGVSSPRIKFVRNNPSEDGLPNVTEVPPLCHECGEKIQELDKLHHEISNKVLEIHCIIKNSSPTGALSWRASAFEQALDNATDKSAVVITKQFVYDLRTGCSLLMDPLDDVDMEQDSTFARDGDFQIDGNQDDHELEIPVKKPGKGKRRKKKAKLRKPRKLLSHRCDICNEKFPYTELEDHVRTHVQDYFVKCPNSSRCGYTCSNRLRLEKHHFKMYPECRAFVGDSRYERECETCNFKTNNLASYKLHVSRSTHETAEKNFPCPIKDCSRSFTVRPSVLLHLETHTYIKRRDAQFCESCKKKVPVSDIEEHLKSVHNATDVIRCPECPHVFMKRNALVKHMTLVHNEENVGVQCDICVDGKKHRSLPKHYYEVHKIGSKAVCEFCNKSFISKVSLDAHKKLYHGDIYVQEPAKVTYVRKSKYSCKKCNEEFESYSTFLMHEVKVHGVDHFRCNVCGKAFTSKSYLTRHEKTHEPGYQPLQNKCDVCGVAYASKRYLAIHKREKHSDTPLSHICDICGSSYKSIHTLGKHKRINHLGRENCVCDICGMKFITKHNLRVHSFRHTGEKQHQCEICGKSFIQKSALTTHRKIHRQEGGALPN